ncbi:alkaline phosphatase D family protein [Polaribacter sargassicola]|uniref:alkaline phosphatase D family protein n=1 Tax=Polaribacter sargassicola TaxID=2836891 RepID=UPI001F1A74B2|nr:alkaline phosphatase D family protein [Polaribacter sp. DS7-9]MCG1037602.1 alkaline phosphatase family protein [Polaribacter sp. DS7-9]
MKTILKFSYFILSLVLISCYPLKNNNKINQVKEVDFTIAFGSCNKQNLENLLWKEVKKNNPNLWIWGGDNIYSDTDDMTILKKDYETLRNQKGYLELVNDIPVMATWDDHDYGLNDGGTEFYKKDDAQQVFLDFFNVDENSPRRSQKGVYQSQIFTTEKGSIKVIVLDTRYFRTALTEDTENSKRYKPNTYGKGTVLGETQWNWLINELNNSKADFNIILSSIQILSGEHGFETWGNFPHEVDKLKKTIVNSKAKGVLLLSGDRHISEFSKTTDANLSYPIIDFTSSGLTHVYSDYSGEPNKYRIKEVVSKISFGLLKFDFDNKEIIMQMRGVNNNLQQELRQIYP